MSQKTFKLVFLGDSSVGKSSVIARQVQNKFNEFLEPTIGAAFLSTNIFIDESKINLQIWDTAGQERFRTMTPSFFRRSHGVLITYDVTNMQSFDSVRFWMDVIGTYCVDGKKIKKILGELLVWCVKLTSCNPVKLESFI